jgi:hypothetical protein
LGGSGTGFPVIAFAEVELDGYDAQGADDNEITITVHEITFGGDCCNVAEANKVLEICDVGTTGGARLASFPMACQTGSTSPGGGGSVTPPPPPDPCQGLSLGPSSATVVLGGPGGRRLTSPLTYTLDVADADDCDSIEIVIGSGGGAPTAAAVRVGTTNQFTATFPTGTNIGSPPAAYAVDAYETGQTTALTSAPATLITS